MNGFDSISNVPLLVYGPSILVLHREEDLD